MNKKKLGTGLIALALVGVVGIGGSLAWFTDTDSKTNTFTTGNVDITLTEPHWNSEYKDNVVPGDQFIKDPTITNNKGSVDAWVRIKNIFVRVDLNNDGQEDESYSLATEENRELFKINLGQKWFVGEDENFYYEDALESEENTNALFTSISVPSTWGNKYANAKVTLDIQAEAVQKDNTGNSAVEAFATVGDENIEPYTLTTTLVD